MAAVSKGAPPQKGREFSTLSTSEQTQDRLGTRHSGKLCSLAVSTEGPEGMDNNRAGDLAQIGWSGEGEPAADGVEQRGVMKTSPQHASCSLAVRFPLHQRIQLESSRPQTQVHEFMEDMTSGD